VSVEIRISDEMASAIEGLQDGAQAFVEALAEHARDEFRGNVHVVTGAMQASASVVTAHGSDYAEHVAAAAALNPKATFAPEEHVEPGAAVVQVPVNYAAYEELGAAGRAAHPALIPAVESTAARAEQIAREVFDLE
jgi:hypothetical protein